MKATTITEVIAALDKIILDSATTNNRAGYFASLYKKVTVAVSQKITEGFFDDNVRMEQLDVVFANFYLDAYGCYRNGDSCSKSWQLAFDENSKWSPMILQHLLAGMNAHIGLDLGVATALVSKGKPLELVKGDFNKINALLAAMVEEVKSSLFDLWPLSKYIVKLNTAKLENDVAGFSMTIARDAAWQVAIDYNQHLISSNGEQYLQQRDADVAGFGNKLFLFPGWVKYVLLAARLFEWGSISSKIRRLAR